MANGRAREVIRTLCDEARLGDAGRLTDGQLLECYLSRRDEAAFAALVRRHGPMVWGVCRRLLADDHDAEDAFQAAFLVLVRKAASIVPRDRVPNWLYGVARQTALKARALAARRRERETPAGQTPEPECPRPGPWDDLLPLLDQELGRLPERYRAAIVLCDLEGRTRREAAQQLGCPEGTLAARLVRGRRLLARRLGRHRPPGGEALPSSPPPPVVAASTLKAAALLAAGKSLAECVSPQAVALSEGVLRTMLTTKLKAAAVVLLAVGLVAGGVTVGLVSGTPAGTPSAAAKREPQEKQPPRGADEPDDPLRAARERQKVEEQRATVVVAATIHDAQKKYRDDPEAALKLLGDALAQTIDNPDLGDRVRNDLIVQLADARRELVGEEVPKVWDLDFKFKNPRLITADVPGQGRKTLWYLWYEVVNTTGEPHDFIPDFELVVGDKVHHDEVLPKVLEAVRRVEDPARLFDVHNSVTVAAEPIPPVKRNAPNRPVVGVAMWDGVDGNVKEFTLYVGGLSNGWSRSGDTVRRKVLEVRFKRTDDGMIPAGPPKWVYRIFDDGQAAEDDPREQVKKLIQQVSDRLSLLEFEMAEVERKRERLLMQINLTKAEIEKAADDAALKAELKKKKEAFEQELAGYDAESTAQVIAREVQKKRLEKLEGLLQRTPDKPPRD